MTLVYEIALGEVLDVLTPTFRSLDLRAVAVESGGRWMLVAGILTASHATTDEIRGRHAELRRTAPTAVGRFELHFDARGVDDLPALLDGLDRGELGVPGRILELDTSDRSSWAPIRSQSMRGNRLMRVEPEERRFPRYEFSIGPTAERRDLLAGAGLAPSDLQLRSWTDLNYWLGGPVFGQHQRALVQLHMVFTIYVWAEILPAPRADAVVLQAQSHGALQSGLSARGWIRGFNGEPRFSAPITCPAPHLRDDLNAFTMTMPFNPLLFRHDDHVEVRLFHDRLHDLDILASAIHGYLHAEDSDPLRRAVLLFELHSRLDSYLEKKDQGKLQALAPFEAGMVWLFSLLCPRSVPLLVDRHAEPLREDGVEIGSADFIGHDPELGLLLFDFTRSVPGEQKAERLRNTAAFLNDRLVVPVRVAIVAPLTLPLLQTAWTEHGVVVIDLPRLKLLWGLLCTGNTAAAREHLLQWVRDVPHIGEI